MRKSERRRSSSGQNGELFRIIHKVPAGDSPCARAKQVQLTDKDPRRAISLFSAAINARDRVDSALKDMSIVLQQLGRSDEAIEAIKSFRHLCPYDSQESFDNVLAELYKGSERIEEEIQMLQLKLKRMEEGIVFGGRRTKTDRSKGKSVEEEISRIAETKSLRAVRSSSGNKQMDEYYAKSFQLALQILNELEPHSVLDPNEQEESQNEIQRSFTSLINRNFKDDNRGPYYQDNTGDSNNPFRCGNVSQCNPIGPRSLPSPPQTMSVDNRKKGPQFKISGERMSSLATRLNENWVGSTGKHATSTFEDRCSSPTAGRNLNQKTFMGI